MNPKYTKYDNIIVEWEKTYIEACIEKLNPSGHVLEIGFGLGYSATAIQNYLDVKKHTIIEYSPEVWPKIEEFKKGHSNVVLIKGRWEDVLRTCGVFDCIFFDDHLLNNTHNFTRWDVFAYNIFKNHTKVGSKISYYTTGSQNPCDMLNDFVKYEFDIFKVDIPSNCKYVKSGKVFVPLLTVFKEQTKSINNFKNKNLINETNIRNAERLVQKYKITENEILDNIINKVPDFKLCVKKDVINTSTTPPSPILFIIDNFYINPMETRRHILQQEFKIRGNYPGQRTISYATQEICNMIQKWIYPFGGKITHFPMEKNDSNYNGAFQYTTSKDRSWVHVDSWNNWAGVLYLTPNAPVNSGTGLYRFKDGTRFDHEQKIRGNVDEINKYTQDVTQWELVDKVGNIFNRLVIFNSNSFHMSMDYFGHNKETGRLFQVFFFSTEKQVC